MKEAKKKSKAAKAAKERKSTRANLVDDAKIKDSRQKTVVYKKDMSYSRVIIAPLSTEKAMRLMGEENKLLFIVDRKATRNDVKKEIETLFNTKVEKVNICIDPKSRKRAWVKFSPDTPAVDIAATLGLI